MAYLQNPASLISRLLAALLLFTVSWSSLQAEEPSASSKVDQTAARFPIPEMTPLPADAAPFRYRDVGKQIPNYTPGKKWGVQGEPRSQMQEPLAPEESLKHLSVPRGFRVELFAAEPDLGGKPIAMNWDDRGRLWVCETYDYPNELQPAGEGRDRIRICEDTDGDGRADKFTVFAEGLSIPTSLLVVGAGVIVFDGTQTLLLTDTDGDDVADKRTRLFGTWAQGDTHGGPSNLQYGLDNWIWAMQGYNDSRLEVGGQKHRFRQGFLRFKPDGSQLEFLRSTDNNTWGLGISEEGIVFGSTANHNPSVHLPIPNRYYEAVRGWTPSLVLKTIADSYLFKAMTDKVRQVDQFGGFTAAAGHALYTARRYPSEYWNRTAFVCEPTGHLVATFVLSPDGASYKSTNPFNLLASDDEWTAPIMAEVGPDGNVWVADWYNYIVQHNPTPIGFKTGKGAAYETPLRDKQHGRIYRIVYDDPTGRTPAPRRTLVGATPNQLVEALTDTNLFWRRRAQRLLVERGQVDVVPALVALLNDRSVDEIGLNVGAIHALWTLQGLGAFDSLQSEALAAATLALKHPSSGVRRNALQVLPLEGASVQAIVQAKLLDDADPQVRLAALLALADRPAVAGVSKALVQQLRKAPATPDRWLSDAMACAAARNADEFLPALVEVEKTNDSMLSIVGIVAEHRARSGPYDSITSLAAALPRMQPSVAEAVIGGLAKGWPAEHRPALTGSAEHALAALLPSLSLEGRSTLVQLGIRWGSSKFVDYAAELASSLKARVADEAASTNDRIAAARELVALQPNDSAPAETLLGLLTPRTSPELAGGLLQAIATSRADGVGKHLAEILPAQTPAVRREGIGLLLGRAAWSSALIDAIEQQQLRWSDLSLDQQRALATHPEAPLRQRAERLLKKGNVLPNADRRKVFDELLAVTRQTGDIARGKLAYAKHCSKCHIHGREGTRIGPDLTGMAVHSKAELLENILDPSRSVEGNFRLYTLATTNGQVLTGLLASESKTAVELFDAEGKKQSVLREEIEQLIASPKSLMPEGFEKQFSGSELSDLLEFLTARGRFLPLPLEKVATAVSTRGMFVDPASDAERLVFDDWTPKTFAGIPFQLVDPRQDRAANVVLLYGPQGLATAMPKSVSLPCQGPAKAIHLLGGISGWGYPGGEKGSVSLIVRLHYAAGMGGVADTTEDHELRNGEHLSDYIRRIDVPGSQFAFDLAGRQLRYLAVQPKRADAIERIELIKGPDGTAPVVMAITVESP